MKTPDKTEPPRRQVSVEVVDETQGSGDLPEPAAVEGWVRAALDRASGVPERTIEVAVLLVSEEAMQVLNRDYRGKDKPTNVLSFPGGELAGLPPDVPYALGDIVLCPAVVAAEAAEQGKTGGQHWAHLCVHGALHLAGYDHVEAADAREMEGLETRVLAELGIPDPYFLPLQ